MNPNITMSKTDFNRIDLMLANLAPVRMPGKEALPPIGGSALLGLSEGDRIAWAHPDGSELAVEVVEVVYQPERAGDYHL